MPGKRKTVVVYACIAVLPLGAASFLVSKRVTSKGQVSSVHETHATNAPFRDGLYWGKLDAENGREPHLSVGRWSTSENRASFKSGYEEGYRQAREKKAAKGSN